MTPFSKYIVVDSPVEGEYAIIGPNFKDHSSLCPRDISPNLIISAGFVTIGKYGVNCYGEAVSLKLQSRDIDREIIRKMIVY